MLARLVEKGNIVVERIGAAPLAIGGDHTVPLPILRAIAPVIAVSPFVAGRAITEASGRVRLENVRAIAEAGVDWISVGSLTHSAPALDLGLDLTTATRGVIFLYTSPFVVALGTHIFVPGDRLTGLKVLGLLAAGPAAAAPPWRHSPPWPC